MTVQLIIYNIICISFFLLALISVFNPTKVNVTANRWFGLFLFSAGCMVLNTIIYMAGAQTGYAQLIVFNELSRFVIAPALYLAILHFTSPNKNLKKQEYLHFMPAAVFAVYILPLSSGYQFLHLPAIVNRVFASVMSVAVPLQLIYYWI
jgi:hypothetical protein